MTTMRTPSRLASSTTGVKSLSFVTKISGGRRGWRRPSAFTASMVRRMSAAFLPGGGPALVDQRELRPVLRAAARHSAEAALEAAVGAGGGDGGLADEAAERGQVLVRDVVRVDQPAR
jgi:hypothetical protein